MKFFPRDILKQLEAVFDDDDLQTLVFRHDDSSGNATDSAVKVIHVPSGIEVECNQFESQIVQHQNGMGAQLTASGLTTRDFWLDFSDGPRESDEYLILKPRHIEKLIRLGIQRGWQPEDAGLPFRIDVSKEEINAGTGRI